VLDYQIHLLILLGILWIVMHDPQREFQVENLSIIPIQSLLTMGNPAN